jgi:ABC-type amino acid transport system permease subunit
VDARATSAQGEGFQCQSYPAWRSFALEAYLFVAAFYFGPCFFMSRYTQALERKLRAGEVAS